MPKGTGAWAAARMGAWCGQTRPSGQPWLLDTLGQPCHRPNLFPPLPCWVQGGQWNSRPLDADRKRQRHQAQSNPNQMRPQTHGGGHCGPGQGPEAGNSLGGTLSGLELAGGAVPWRVLTLLSPQGGVQDTGQGELVAQALRHSAPCSEDRSVIIVMGTMQKGPATRHCGGQGPAGKGQGMLTAWYPGLEESQTRALALALAPAGRPRRAMDSLPPSGWLLG